MTTDTVYQFTGGRLRPIPTLPALPIGTHVSGGPYSKYGFVYGQNPDGIHSRIVWDSGDLTELPTEWLTRLPYRLHPERIATAGEIAEALALVESEKIRRKAQAEADTKKHAEDFSRFEAELRSCYPWASATGRDHVRAAKNLKKELAKAFPGVAFEVRSESYAGGNSVNASWTDGPTTGEVRAISDKYQGGDFDGMTDSYNDDRSAFSAAVRAVLGQSKYVFANRHDSRKYVCSKCGPAWSPGPSFFTSEGVEYWRPCHLCGGEITVKS